MEAYLACPQKMLQTPLQFSSYCCLYIIYLITETNHWTLALIPLPSFKHCLVHLWFAYQASIFFTLFLCLNIIKLFLSCLITDLWPHHGFGSRGTLWLETGTQHYSVSVFAEGLYLLMLKMSFLTCSLGLLRLFQYSQH